MSRRSYPPRGRAAARPPAADAAAPQSAPAAPQATPTGPHSPSTGSQIASPMPQTGPTGPDAELGAVDDPPLPPLLAVVSVLVFTAVAVLSAAVEVVLVPFRVGNVVVPVSVALALVGNVAIPVLSRRAVPATLAAVLPAVAWVATVLFLSQARPEGDVLLVGTAPLVYVTYALLGVGILAAMVTVLRGQAHALANERPQVLHSGG